MKVTKKKHVVLAYTILFAVLCVIVFYPFYINNLSLVWGRSGQDGTSQHLASLIYYGDYIRTFFSNLIHGNFHFPMWDNSIGFGSDILTSLNYYAIGDPLNLIYVFASKSNAQYLYCFMTLFRAYLAGISFIIFSFYLKKNPNGILLGSLTYVFSGVFLNYAIRHPFFLNPMIYLPLLIMGVEKIYRKERPYLFTIVVTISAMSNFYFFYMLTAAAVIYALIRFPVYKEDGFFRTLGRFAGWYILGLGLSMIILLPVLIGFMGNARSSSSMNYFNIFLYQKAYYQSIIQQSIAYHPAGRATSLNFIALAYCAAIALIFKKSKERFAYKTSLIVSFIFIMMPIFGYAMHAFSYPMNRWSFVLALVIASILTEMYEDLLNLTFVQTIGIIIGIVFYYAVYKHYSDGAIDLKYAVLILVLTAIVLLAVNKLRFLSKFHLNHLILCGLAFVSIGVSGFGHYSTRFNAGVLDRYVPFETAYDLLGGKETTILNSASVKNNQLNRVESIDEKVPNWGVVNHIPNTTNYYSITDKNVSDTLQNLGLSQYQYKFKFKKLDMRENLLNLYHVKYLITNTKNNKKIPDGYQLIKENENSKLYENKNILPFGYTYNSYITEKDFDKLNPAQKEKAMLQNAVVGDDTQTTGLKKSSSDTKIVTKDVYTNYKYHKTGKDRTYVNIKIPKKYLSDNCYLYLQNVRSIPANGGRNHILYEGKNNTKFNVTIAGHKTSLYNAEKNSVYDTGSRNYLVEIDTANIRDNKDYVNLTLTLIRPNDYKIQKISIVQVDKKAQQTALNTLRTDPHLTDISYDGANHFSGNITTKDERILTIPFTYSKGWKATDNGKNVKIMKVNGMFCGLYLKPGKHNIRLNYTTPGLKIGACISVVSLIILIVLAVRGRKLSKYTK